MRSVTSISQRACIWNSIFATVSILVQDVACHGALTETECGSVPHGARCTPNQTDRQKNDSGKSVGKMVTSSGLKLGWESERGWAVELSYHQSLNDAVRTNTNEYGYTEERTLPECGTDHRLFSDYMGQTFAEIKVASRSATLASQIRQMKMRMRIEKHIAGAGISAGHQDTCWPMSQGRAWSIALAAVQRSVGRYHQPSSHRAMSGGR